MPLALFPTQAKKQSALPVLPNCHACGAKATSAYPAQVNPRQSADVVFVVDKLAGDYDLALADNLAYSDLVRYCSRVGFPIQSAAIVPVAACYSAKDEAWRHCQPLLASELKRLNPKLIIPIGHDATSSVGSRYWGTSAEIQERWYGYQIPERSLNAWICPLGLAGKEKRNTIASNTWLYKWLQAAKHKIYRPWGPESVDPLKCVNWMINTSSAVYDVLKRAQAAPIVAFDYETTGLKPEWDCHSVVSMGLSWVENGEVVGYSFLTHPEHWDAIREFLQSPVRKIAANMKFEDRWSRHFFKSHVAGWQWDTLLATHWENPTTNTKSHKFQAFTRLGVPYYAGDVEAYFDSERNSKQNNIFKAPVGQLLLYNAMDAVTELLLASIQMVEGGIIKKHFVPEKYLPKEQPNHER